MPKLNFAQIKSVTVIPPTQLGTGWEIPFLRDQLRDTPNDVKCLSNALSRFKVS